MIFMSGKEYKAKSIEEALERALNEMMLTRDDIEYEVITQPSNGFLGIGRRDAVIRVKKKVIEELKDIVADIKEERRAAQPEAEQAKPAAEPASQAPVAKEAPVEEAAPKVAVQETAAESEAVAAIVLGLMLLLVLGLFLRDLERVKKLRWLRQKKKGKPF